MKSGKIWLCAAQTVIKPFSQRVAVLGSTVAACSPAAGTVSAASIANTGPGPEAFAAPDSATCCASAHPFYSLHNPLALFQPPSAGLGASHCNDAGSTHSASSMRRNCKKLCMWLASAMSLHAQLRKHRGTPPEMAGRKRSGRTLGAEAVVTGAAPDEATLLLSMRWWAFSLRRRLRHAVRQPQWHGDQERAGGERGRLLQQPARPPRAATPGTTATATWAARAASAAAPACSRARATRSTRGAPPPAA